MTAINASHLLAAQTHTPSKMERWEFLIPTISVIALGSIFIPHFALGIAFGTALLFAEVTVILLLRCCFPLPAPERKNEVSEYKQNIHRNPIQATLLGPFVEEVIFRSWILPALRAITGSAPFAAIGSGILFGAAHLVNPHDGARFQAVASTVWGIAVGFFAISYGLPAAIAAHIANNTIATSASVALS
ncbi:MAG: CPBP family intramembrane metalloprotease [Verrucomicrobia bacterium]|nr:CPBP family intramembrane metalloprotease [Verrucomicrobiota bacterium]